MFTCLLKWTLIYSNPVSLFVKSIHFLLWRTNARVVTNFEERGSCDTFEVVLISKTFYRILISKPTQGIYYK